MFYELGSMIAENANKIIELQKENAELKSHCEFLRECCHRLGNGLRVEKDEVDSIPQHSLNEIKAQAIEEMMREIPTKSYVGLNEIFHTRKSMIEYVAILKGEK